jgi:aldose 1-epimerase
LLNLSAGHANLTVDPAAGGRIAALDIFGFEVLVARQADPLQWGCYPMVPFAGRVRHGHFTFDGTAHRLPLNMDPHAIHGFGFTNAWTIASADSISTRLEPPWPFPATVEQRYSLNESALTVEMTLHAETRQPVSMGWHPWFRRDIGTGAPLALSFGAAEMYELDDEMIPTGRLVPPSVGPWDNCFRGLQTGPSLRWGDSLAIEITSPADHWVVFDEPTDALCVEPQTAPPDALNSAAPVVEAGQSATVSMTFRWGSPQ